MTIRELLEIITDQLKSAGITGARSDAEILVADVLKQDKAWLLAHRDEKLTHAVTKKIQQLAHRRASREPMSYVLGHREFVGLDFKIDHRALTPRVETETIVAEVAKRAPQGTSLLDIGTGSGAMAIALKHLRPDMQVTASEVSTEALDLARENAARLLSATDITFLNSDLFSNIPDQFDVIVANLPYVTREMELMPEVQKEPDEALFGGANDGLDLYRRFFEQLPPHLTVDAQVWIESDPWQQPALIKLAEATGLSPIFQDYFILGFEKTS